MHINLRAGEKFYLNGAVIRADRKVSLELMNDATFLLEAHVMSPEMATTPLRQLYFVVQMMLMNPHDTRDAGLVFNANVAAMALAYTDETVLATLLATKTFVTAERFFEALKALRAIFARDDALLGAASLPQASQKAA